MFLLLVIELQLRRGKLVANKLAKNSSPEEVTALITGAIETA